MEYALITDHWLLTENFDLGCVRTAEVMEVTRAEKIRNLLSYCG